MEFKIWSHKIKQNFSADNKSTKIVLKDEENKNNDILSLIVVDVFKLIHGEKCYIRRVTLSDNEKGKGIFTG